MPSDAVARAQIARQVAHWTTAARRLQRIDDQASASAWAGLERYLGVAIRRHLASVVIRLQREGDALRGAVSAARTAADVEHVRQQVLAFRRQYLRAETTIDFYADAVNTRTSPQMAALLQACDAMAYRSMVQVLDQLGKPTPLVLTYIDKGLGASILKAGLRLWDGGTASPAAAIKIVRHNLQRPTALIHEAGHQAAHILGWNDDLALALRDALSSASPEVAETWARWAPEVAADTFAFAHTGYAAVAALHDVVAGDTADVFRFIPGDPHPISYIRVLLGIEMCRQFFGAGPWDDLSAFWRDVHPIDHARPAVRGVVRRSLGLLPTIVHVCLRAPARAFGGRPLTALLNPDRVAPGTLRQMEDRLGPALYTSPHWLWTESLRLLALTGYKEATRSGSAAALPRQEEDWMLRLGTSLQAA